MNEDFWKRFPPIPGFDCVKMKRDIQAIIYEEIKDLSQSERIDYFNRSGDDFRKNGRVLARNDEQILIHEDEEPYGWNSGKQI